ncbi:hypothetical protein [Catenuloplanes indicus]|uniref:Uncharacterized protein n=1 Tax=Catenuloplanes indicus TaxID=137267 RepID=A0AAE3VW72_9ACTN|nr:hypothetical protein [Catenuloplanes indicus]MDQ0364372.1 hypothetical protein [Catenuloplanes indicus]
MARDWPGGLTTLITPDEVSVSGPPDATFGALAPVAVSETLREAYRLLS